MKYMLCVFLLLISFPAYTAQQYYVEITFDASKFNSDMTNVPLLIDGSEMPAGFWAHVQSDGEDIVIYDGDDSTKLYRELVAIDTTAETMELYYNEPSVSSTTNFKIYLRYGDATATETNDTETWNDETFVVHFQDDTDDSAGSITSTTESLTYTTSGKITKAGSFDGSSDYVKYSNATGIDVATYDKDFTFSAWINGDTYASHERAVMSKDGYPTASQREWQFHVQTDSKLRTLVFFSDGTHSGSNLYATTAMSTSTWYYLTATYDGSIMRLYINGTQEDTYSTTKSQKDGNGSLAIGRFPNQSSGEFDGYIDECRIGTYLSADEIDAQYKTTNNPSDLFTVSAEQEIGGAGYPYTQIIWF